MSVRDLFLRPVEREITTVVKVSDFDEGRIAEELDEYVITAEVEAGLLPLLEALAEMSAGSSERFSAWVCGPDGCGKSHFAKVLRHLLENPVVNGASAAGRFISRLPDGPRRDRFAAALRELGSSFSFQTIPFQVKAEEDALNRSSISEVMYRQFLAHRGLSRTLWVGALELELMRRGEYETFCQAIADLEGLPWPEVREEALIVRGSIVQALRRALPGRYADEGAASRTMDDIQAGLIMGPSRLAAELSAHLGRLESERPHEKHRLVYIVDDLRQPWGGDEARMLPELQAIAEQFTAQGRGRLWLIVTWRESLGELLARLRRGQAGLSAIADRFTFLELTTEQAGQVAMERILEKKETARQTVAGLFERYRQTIAGLTAFADAGGKLPACTQDDFVRAYPLLPHYFPLLRDILAGLRLDCNERSMLALVQALVRRGQEKPGSLVSLDELYDLLEAAIPPQERGVVDGLESSGEKPLPKRVLKALCLLGHTGLVPSTPANVACLLVNDLAVDLPTLQAQVRQALDRLSGGGRVIQAEGKYRLQAVQKVTAEEKPAPALDRGKMASYRNIMALVKVTRDAEEIVPALSEDKVRAALEELERINGGGQVAEQWEGFVRTAQGLQKAYRAVYEELHRERYTIYRAIEREATGLGADTSRIGGFLCERTTWNRGGVTCAACQQSLLNLYFQVASQEIARRELLRK